MQPDPTTTGSGSDASEVLGGPASYPREIAGTPESPALVSTNSVATLHATWEGHKFDGVLWAEVARGESGPIWKCQHAHDDMRSAIQCAQAELARRLR